MKRRRPRREPRHFTAPEVEFMTTPERDAKIMELRQQKLTLRAIGAVVGMSPNGVMHAIRRIEAGGGAGRDPRP
jgi:hypothetical protein